MTARSRALAGCVFLAVGVTGAQAVLFEVGPGKPYATIQGAVDAAALLDVGGSGMHNQPPADPVDIVVYAGTYTENVNIPPDLTASFNGPNDSWKIRSNPGDKVLVVGGINVGIDRDKSTFDGINVKAVGRSGYFFGQTARSNTIKNAFVYGGNSTAVNFGGIVMDRLFGHNVFDHLTIWDMTFGIISSTNSNWVMTNGIVAGSGTYGMGLFSGNPNTMSYSNIYNFPVDNCNTNGVLGDCSGFPDGGNNVLYPFGLDPEFASTDPNDPHFLWLAQTSPSAGTGSSAGAYTMGQFNMGALPAVPEPATMCLLLPVLGLVGHGRGGRRTWTGRRT